jgi:hypothetical protein
MSGHTSLHVPQLALSVLTLTHLPEHAVVPVGHWQAPPLQIWPVGHAWPHVPQWAELV